MRRKNLAVAIVLLPSANALALANFQQITSALVPLTCLVAYNGQIPTCTTSDFNTACSSTCQSALISQAQRVKASCLTVSASSTTLLGMIMNGGIIQALCPRVTRTTKISSSKASVAPTPIPALASGSAAGTSIPTIPIPNPSLDPTSKSVTPVTSVRSSTAVPPVSVTIRTSPSAIAPPVSTRSSAVASFSFTPPQSQVSNSRSLSPPMSSTSISTSAVAATPTTSSKSATSATSTANGGDGNDGSSISKPGSTTTSNPPSPGKTTASSATSTSAAGSPAKPTNKVTAGGDTGGGSPFDSQSSQGNLLDGSSALCALVIAVWATIMFAR